MLTGLWRILDEAWGVQDGADNADSNDDGDGDGGEDGSSSSGSPPPSPRAPPNPSSAPLAIEDQPASLEVDAEEVGDAGAESGPANPSLSHETSGDFDVHDPPHPCGPENSSSPMGGTSSIDDAKSKILAKVEAFKTGA